MSDKPNHITHERAEAIVRVRFANSLGGTHYDGCEASHDGCALLRYIEQNNAALTAERERSDKAGARERSAGRGVFRSF